ncbi:MAG TPA: HAD family hydrolase [Novosphingobium sp.]|nr:HAD family hydrolase [Novosphingobium sp.]
MARPLIVSDCDEVLLHMVGPFRDWLGEEHGVAFSLQGNDFAHALRHADSGELLDRAETWRLLDLFFDEAMHRQYPFAGVVEAIATLSAHADIVVLTNLTDRFQAPRARQLAEHGLPLKVYTNQGPKGPALKAILEEYRPARAIFIDDIAQHHGSAAEQTPDVIRLHLCGEPMLAPHIPCAHAAGHAHARIDDWATALPWLLGQLA